MTYHIVFCPTFEGPPVPYNISTMCHFDTGVTSACSVCTYAMSAVADRQYGDAVPIYQVAEVCNYVCSVDTDQL